MKLIYVASPYAGDVEKEVSEEMIPAQAGMTVCG